MGLKHVVFGIHGLRASWKGACGDCQMIKICGHGIGGGSGPCDDMTVPEFEHLVFIFPSSSMTSGNKYTWSSSNGNTETFSAGLENLAQFLCGDADGFAG